MSLATVERGTNGTALAARRTSSEGPAYSIDEVWAIAERAAGSRMFGGIDTPDKAFMLMMICQAEGLHPIQAVKRYDVIQGRPAMKAAAIQAEFQARGGLIELIESTPTVARARFSHPRLQPTPVELTARIEDYRHLTGKDNWKHYPSDMLWARLVARGVRRIDPGVVTGIGSVEEAWDAAEIAEQARRPQVEPTNHAGPMPPPRGDVPVPGGPVGGIDGRNLVDIIRDAATAIGKDDAAILAHLRNQAVQQSLITGDPPTKRQKLLETLAKLYSVQRDWVREKIAELVPEQAAPVEAALPPQPTATYTEADEPSSATVPVPDGEPEDDAWPEGRT